MDSSLRWTYLKPYEIVAELAKKGYVVSKNIVRTLLKTHHYVKRKAQKNITMGSHPDRNAQFENIANIQQNYFMAGNPVISMDTKKKSYWAHFIERVSSIRKRLFKPMTMISRVHQQVLLFLMDFTILNEIQDILRLEQVVTLVSLRVIV